MNLRSPSATVAAGRPAPVGRRVFDHLRLSSVDRLKSALGPTLGVEFWARYNTRLAALSFDPRSLADPFEVRWVDPTAVRYRPRYGCFDKLTTIGSIRGGVWDRTDRDVTDHPTVRGLTQRFGEGRAWEDTVYVAHNVAAIEAGAVRKGCSTAAEFLDVRCVYLDALFERIRDGGYETQEALDGAMVDHNRFETTRDRLLTNEVGVNVGRDGALLLNSGFHRFAIAGVLGLEEIPVQVVVRHRAWQRAREEVLRAGERPPPDPHAKSHPDLVDVATPAVVA